MPDKQRRVIEELKRGGILDYIRQNCYLEEGDESMDGDISQMPPNEMFSRYLEWNGLLGSSWAGNFKNAVETIDRAAGGGWLESSVRAKTLEAAIRKHRDQFADEVPDGERELWSVLDA